MKLNHNFNQVAGQPDDKSFVQVTGPSLEEMQLAQLNSFGGMGMFAD